MGKHAPDSRSSKSDENKPKWKHCSCPIYASGTLGGKFDRRNTKETDFVAAQNVANVWIAADSWDALPPLPPASGSGPVESKGKRTEVGAAVDAWVEEHRNQKAAKNTIRNSKSLGNKVKRVAKLHGCIYLDELTPKMMKDLMPATHKRDGRDVPYLQETIDHNVAVLRSFFEYAISQGFTNHNPLPKVQRLPGFSRPTVAQLDTRKTQKFPLSNVELRYLRAACDLIPTQAPPNVWGEQPIEWNGDDVLDFIDFNVVTGLRISDICEFRITRLSDNNRVFLRATKKNHKPVFGWLAPQLADRIRARAAKFGPRPFGDCFNKGRVYPTESLTAKWDARFREVVRIAKELAADDGIAVGEVEQPFDRPVTPHRLRHTFARMLFEKGKPATRVAELMGDTVETVLANYAGWCSELQDAATADLQDVFSDFGQPKPEKPSGLRVVARRRNVA